MMKYESCFYADREKEENRVKILYSVFDEGEKIIEYHVVLELETPQGNFEAQLGQIHRAWKWWREGVGNGVQAVFRRYFLSDSANQEKLLRACLESCSSGSISVVQQPPVNGGKVALWIYGIWGAEEVISGARRSVWEHNGYCHFWNAGAHTEEGDAEAQTTLLLDDYQRELYRQGCSLSENCVRTWLFVRDIDVRYEGVVKARKAFFESQGLRKDTHYIASTGIEGRSEESRSFVRLDAYAVKGLREEQICYLHALTHLNPTWEYGVTFERGVSILYGDRKQAFISGTASIDRYGRIVYPGEVEKQTERMWQNVGALLEEGGYGFDDVAQAIVYLRDGADYQTVNALFRRRFPDIPVVFVLAAVCRSGWLVEMECIAVRSQKCADYRAF